MKTYQIVGLVIYITIFFVTFIRAYREKEFRRLRSTAIGGLWLLLIEFCIAEKSPMTLPLTREDWGIAFLIVCIGAIPCLYRGLFWHAERYYVNPANVGL